MKSITEAGAQKQALGIINQWMSYDFSSVKILRSETLSDCWWNTTTCKGLDHLSFDPETARRLVLKSSTVARSDARSHLSRKYVQKLPMAELFFNKILNEHIF